MIALFGVSSESTAASDAHRRDHKEIEPELFSTDSIHAMFQELDMNGDGYLCTEDLGRWMNHEGSPHALHLDEISAFLRAGKGVSSSKYTPAASLLYTGNSEIQPSEESINSDTLIEDGLASCLALFPALAFDWNAPFSSGSRSIFTSSSSSSSTTTTTTFQSHSQGNSFNRDNAAVLFRRLDSDSDGWITAADLRLWRRMLPLGRSEDDLVLSFFPADTDAKSVPAPHKVPTRRRSSLFTTTIESPANGCGSVITARAAKELPGLKPWNFYMVLRDNPMLIAELCTQVALLDFIMRGGHHEDVNVTGKSPSIENSEDDIFKLLDFEGVCDIRGSIARSEQLGLQNDAYMLTVNDVPSDNLISAFTCVAKLKLCRLASAYREATAQDESMTKNIFRAFDIACSGYINAHDIQVYLQKHANLYAVTVNELYCCLLHQQYDHSQEAINQSTLEAILPSPTLTDSYTREGGHLLDEKALQEVLSKIAHQKLASLLYRVVQVQQEHAR